MTEDLYWQELTPAQQEQAAVLGYTQVLWDEAQNGDYDITDNATPSESAGQDDDYPVVGGTATATDSAAADDDLEDDEGDNFAVDLMAAICFLMVGVLNWLRERQVFHIWMVQGGVFGILAALCMNWSDFASLLLQTVSVHCFLLEAVFMLKLRATLRPVEGLETMSYALWGADLLYAAGAIIQVVLVYWLHVDGEASDETSLAYCEVFASWFWFFTAVIYTKNNMALANKRIQEDAMAPTLTIERRHPNGEKYTIRPAALQLRQRHSVVLT